MSPLILLIEDEALILDSIKDFLEVEDYRVIATENGLAEITLF